MGRRKAHLELVAAVADVQTDAPPEGCLRCPRRIDLLHRLRRLRRAIHAGLAELVDGLDDAGM